MMRQLKDQTGIVVVAEVILVLVVLSGLTKLGLAHGRAQRLVSPAGVALEQVTIDLAPSKPGVTELSTTGCQAGQPCPSDGQFYYADISQLGSFEQRLVDHGWQLNSNLVDVSDPTKSSDTSQSYTIPYIKVVNNQTVCLEIGNNPVPFGKTTSTDIQISVEVVGCKDETGWRLYYPALVPARYISKTMAVTGDNVLSLNFRLSTAVSSNDFEPYLEIDESKQDSSYAPPASCPVLSFIKNLTCTLYLTTPSGKKVYVSDSYNTDTVYLSCAINNTVFTIRRFYEGVPGEVLSDQELSSLVDSLQPVDLAKLKTEVPQTP
jgi:hypothetical protein